MRKKIIYLALAALLSPFLASGEIAQAHWQDGEFYWVGSVRGTGYIYIRDDQVEYRNDYNGSFRNTRHRFTAELPRRDVRLDLDVRRGNRNNVRIVQHPSSDNRYVAIIRIDNLDRFYEDYELVLRWRERGFFDDPFSRDSRRDGSIQRFHWQGNVDGTDVLRIVRRRVDIEHREALPIQNQDYSFTAPLPQHDVDVRLENVQGRGRVRLIEQPRRYNNYTAVLLIEDPQAGASFYSFDLFWEDEHRHDDDYPYDRRETDRRGRQYDADEFFSWSGRVDGSCNIYIRGRNVEIRTLSGASTIEYSHNFTSPLPDGAVTVNIFDGRGRGRILLKEQPSASNNFTAVIWIEDPKGGSDDYSFRLGWSGRDARRLTGQRDDRDYDRPTTLALTWSGRVDGRDIIRISGSSLHIDHIEAQPITDAQFNFYRPLPRRNIDVVVNKRRGRGAVRILEQPSRANNFTLSVEINDSRGGSDYYQLEFYW